MDPFQELWDHFRQLAKEEEQRREAFMDNIAVAGMEQQFSAEPLTFRFVKRDH